MARAPHAGARRALHQRLRPASRRPALARRGRQPKHAPPSSTGTGAGSSSSPQPLRARGSPSKSMRAGTTRCTTASCARRSRLPADLVIKDTHYHSVLQALDLLQHRLEPDSQLCRNALARQAAAAGQTAVLRRCRGSAARARQAGGPRPPDRRDGDDARRRARRRGARLSRVRRDRRRSRSPRTR